MLRIQMIALLVSFVIFVLIFELVRRRKIREEYSLLWIFAGVALLIMGIFPDIVTKISKAIGAYYLTTILLIAFSFLFFIVLHFSVVISKLTGRIQSLMQHVSILDFQLGQIKDKK